VFHNLIRESNLKERMMQWTRRKFSLLVTGLFFGAVVSVAHAAGAPHVMLKTNMGNIVLELYPEKAPLTVDNFLKYVKKGQYNGTIFHRVIDNFMIQGGGFDKDMKQRPTGHTIQNEAKNGLKNERYTLAMARLPDPHSASAQFFINVNDNASLDYPGRDGWGYCVFGKVIQGMDVVDKIKAVPTADAGMYQNVPVAPVIIESANITK